MDNVCVCTLACNSELQPLMRLACSHFHVCLLVAVTYWPSYLFRLDRSCQLSCICWGRGAECCWWVENNFNCVPNMWGLTVIQYCSINNRVRCVSVPNERLCARVVAYLGWQRIRLWMPNQDIPIILSYTSTHKFDTLSSPITFWNAIPIYYSRPSLIRAALYQYLLKLFGIVVHNTHPPPIIRTSN